MYAYLVRIFLIILIKEITLYFPVKADIYSHENEVLLLLVRIQLCIRKSNDAGSLKHRAKEIYGRFASLLRIDLHSQSWKIKLEKEEIASRCVDMILCGDLDEKPERPRMLTAVRGC